MRVIITGGSGLVGQRLTQRLTDEGHEVIVLSRNADWVVGLPKGARAVDWDAKTAQGWGHLANGAGAIINLAGENLAGNIPFGLRWTESRQQKILSSRVNAGNAVLEAIKAAENKPGVLIQASAIGYYGDRDDEVTEQAKPGDDFLASVCQQWEATTVPVEEMGVRRVIIRSAPILDNKDGILPILTLPYRMFVGGPLGSGKQHFAWIHIQDEVEAILFLLNNEDAEGPYNLSAPEPLPNKEFGKQIGRTLGRPSFFPVPEFLFNVLFAEGATMVIDGKNVLPEKLESAGYEFKYPTAREALNDLLK